MTQVVPESDELHNNEVDEIVCEIQGTVNNAKMTQSERDARVSVLLTEMEQYTQPLIQQIDALSNYQKHLMLCRVARLCPETVQKEIKSVQHLANISITNEDQVRPSLE
eukprot:908661_1